MSVQTEIDRISAAVQNAHLKVIEKGGTSAAPYLVANLPDAIDTIPEATEPKLQAKSATPSETAQTVKPDSGYDGLSQVSVGAISKTYVGSSVPKQAAQTITPGTADKTIESGRYLTGAQTIKGDAKLVAGNIKSGVSIFGVAGTMTAGEDVTAETNTYTSLLDDLEAAVDALPDAGSGGGASVETCSIRLICNTTHGVYGYSYLAYRYGQFVPVFFSYYQNGGHRKIDVTLPDVICGGYIYVTVKILYGFLDTSINGEATTQKEYLTSSIQPVLLVHAPSTAGSTSTVTIIDND